MPASARGLIVTFVPSATCARSRSATSSTTQTRLWSAILNSTSPGPARMPFTALRSRISPSCGASQGIESEISRVRSSSLMAGSGVARFSNLRRAPFSSFPVAPALMAERYSAAALERAGL